MPLQEARRRRPLPKARPLPKPRPPALDEHTATRRSRRRLLWFVAVMCVLAAAIGARITDLQVSDRDQSVAYGARLRDGYRVIPAGRGAIFDRSGNALALSVAMPNVVADPAAITDPVRVADVLAPVLEADRTELIDKLGVEGSRYQVLAPTVDRETVDAVKAAIEQHDLPGIDFEEQFVRQNPSDRLARNVVGRTYEGGRVDAEGRQGQTGIELALDESLTGTAGRVTFEKDPNGNPIAGTPEHVEPAVPGTDVYLTLDQTLQHSAEQALIEQVRSTGAQQAMAVMTRPSTGEVLAMASVARNDDDTITNTGDNRPVTTVFEPGSVNKMITIAGAMEEGLLGPDTVIDVPDHLQVADHLFRDHDPHPTVPWSTTDILVTSSNVGTIKIAQRLGAEGVDEYLRRFGFGTAGGSDIPGEVNGLMLPLENWSGTSIGAIPIGQGISVTALQMLAAYNVIANDGVYVAPKLISATDDGSGVKPSEPSDQRRVISTETAVDVRQMLSKVVSDGTGAPAQVPGYTAFGKTGTARIPQFGGDPEDAYKDEHGRYHYESSFVGGIDGADLTIIVTVQDAKTSIYGSQLAGPVFSHLASLALRRDQIPPPALTDPADRGIPELSATARQIQGEDPGLAVEPGQD